MPNQSISEVLQTGMSHHCLRIRTFRCVLAKLSWKRGFQLLTAQLLLILTQHFAKGKKEYKLLKLNQKSKKMLAQNVLTNEVTTSEIKVSKMQQSSIKGEFIYDKPFIIYYNNYKLFFCTLLPCFCSQNTVDDQEHGFQQ